MLHHLGDATIVRMVPEGQMIEFESVQIRAIRCVTLCEYARTSKKAQKT